MIIGYSNEFKIDNTDEFKKLTTDYIEVEVNEKTGAIKCFMKEEGVEYIDCMWVISNDVIGEDVYVYAEGDEIESISEYAEHIAKKNEDFFSQIDLTKYIQKHLLEKEKCIFTFKEYDIEWTITKNEIRYDEI